jgi:hypothetical protein
MDALDRLGEYVREHRSGMLTDLVFAIAWVTLVNVIFELLDGPDWAYYMFMLAGIVAYFGMVWSFEIARERKG